MYMLLSYHDCIDVLWHIDTVMVAEQHASEAVCSTAAVLLHSVAWIDAYARLSMLLHS